MNHLNYISVTESAHREVNATGVKIVVKIAGQAFFSGSEAFKKAAEVAECLDKLVACGIDSNCVRIKNVSTQVESGFLSKSSSATYWLEIVCNSMNLLGPAVGTIASLKHSKIESMEWIYFEAEKIQREILQEAVALANAAAQAITSALGTSVNGVHRLKYEVAGWDSVKRRSLGATARARKSKMVDEDLALVSESLNLTHTTKVTVTVTADFLV